jgi:hypothetical protein
MKLVYCTACGDVVRLIEQEWRTCACGSAGGQYNEDRMSATVGGTARVFGIGNYFFEEMYTWLTRTQKRRYRKAHTGQPDTDCWWGEWPTDKQVFRIKSAKGPRIKMKVKAIDEFKNEVTIKDKRDYLVAGERLRSMVVTANPKPSFKIK